MRATLNSPDEDLLMTFVYLSHHEEEEHEEYLIVKEEILRRMAPKNYQGISLGEVFPQFGKIV